jgi:hypothetical protein
MKVNVSQIVTSSAALKKFGGVGGFDTGTSGGIGAMLLKVQSELDEFETKKKAALDKFTAEVTALLAKEVDLDYSPVEIPKESTVFTPHEMNALALFIKVKE